MARRHAERLGLGFRAVALGDVAVLDHAVDHPVAALDGGFRAAERMIVRRSLRQGGEIGGLGNRQFGDGRQSRGGDRDRRPGGQNGRSDREKRESRRDDVAAPIVEQQKSQRNKAKDKERDNKKKEYRDEAFDGKGKKGKKADKNGVDEDGVIA